MFFFGGGGGLDLSGKLFVVSNSSSRFLCDGGSFRGEVNSWHQSYLSSRSITSVIDVHLITPGILHAKTIILSETIFFATARIFLEPGREFNY